MSAYADTDLDLFASIAEAETERDRAFARLDAADYRDETKDVLAAILDAACRLSEFSANDCRAAMPDGVNTNRIGRAFALAQEAGWIEFVRLTKSSDVGTHGKRINVYRLARA